MIALVQQILIGISAAVALSVAIGYGLARLLARESPLRRAVRQNPDVAPPVSAGPEVSVAKLGPDIGQSIAHLVGDLDRAGIIILRQGDQGRQIGVLMSIEQYELLHATEQLAKDPDHLIALIAPRARDRAEPEVSWQSVVA